jgi:hypothetical protein
MRTHRHFALLILGALAAAGPVSGADPAPVPASARSTLATSAQHVRQLAFDGDPATYFESSGPPGAADHFTLDLERPVVLKSATATTGRSDGSDKLTTGSLEVSVDGETFEPVAKFEDGRARFEGRERALKAIRIRPTADSGHPLVVREIDLESAEPIARFQYPVEISVDVTGAPEMKDWAERAARICEHWYPRINEELKSEGYKPPVQISIRLRTDYRGVAEASGARITGSVKYFQDHPDDFGAMVHETCHVVQRYRGRRNPGWLVEGVADYVRFFVYEPGQAGPVNPNRARFDASYRTTATFLDYVARKYDKDIVRKLNKLMREGQYKEESFRELTGKTVQELGQEWTESLRAAAKP